MEISRVRLISLQYKGFPLMKNTLLAAASVAVLAFGASAAHAQDTWTGWYGAAHAGGVFQPNHDDETITFDRDLNGTFGDTVVTTTPADAFSPGFNGAGAAQTTAPAGGVAKDKDGGDFGARFGYDMQSGAWVFGGLVEVSGYNASDSVSAYSVTPANYVMTRELNSTIALRGRVGYTWNNYLPYVTAGVVRGDVDHRFATSNVANSFTQSGTDDKLDGYQVGVGVERRFEDSKWTLGAEYLYTSLDDADYTVRAGNNGTTPVGNAFLLGNPNGTDFRRSEDRFAVHAVRLTVGYRF